MLDAIIRAIVEASRESRRSEEARRAWEQQRAWEEQQRLWQTQQLAQLQAQQWVGQPAVQYAPPPLPRSAPLVAEKPAEVAAGGISASPPAAAPAPRRGAQPSVPPATAPAIARWMRPGNLRRQFVLTEILKPPLALRAPRD